MTRIFIGSTKADLEEYRQAAITICNKLQLPMVAMEHFPAMSKDAIAGSLKKVEEADVYVGIFAFRYGYIAEGYEKSVTEMEFDHAEKLKLPQLCFLAEEEGWPPEKYDSENLDKMLAFRGRINRSLIRATFTTPDNFAVELMHALIEELGLRQVGADSAVLVTEAAAIPGKTDKFRGRTALTQEVQTAFAEQSSVLLHGFGGMGKTALAAECAANHLPLLWVKAGTASTDALFEALARPFEMQKAVASQTGEAKIHLMRQILASSGVRLLLVDDVWDGHTLNDLTRAVPPAMKLLVTSRLLYSMKPRFNVGKLDEKEALEVLSIYAGENLKQNPDAPALCAIVGYHALALKIAGSMLNVVAGLTPKELYDRIASTPHQIKTPNQFEEAGHESIEAILEVSLAALDEKARQVFFAFGTLFAPSATPELLSLTLTDVDLSPAQVEDALTTLSLHGLADRFPATPESAVFYRIHDLSYSYARARATDEQRRRALDACLSYTQRYNEPSLTNFAALRPELDNFMGAAAYAMQIEAWAKVERFAWSLYLGSEILDFQGFYTQAVTLLQQAALAAEKQGNRSNQGAHLGNLGSAYLSLGDYPKAIEHYQQVLTIAREMGDKGSEGNALGNLGNTYNNLGDYAKAIEYHQQALTISREIGDKRGEGNRLGNLGNAYFSLGDYAKAIEYHQQALTISREIGDKRGEGSDLGNLGSAYQNLGDYPKAIEYHQQALTISRAIGDKRGEGNQLGNLGIAYDSLGNYPKAIEYHQQALTIAHEIGNKSAVGSILGNLGNAYRSLGDYPRAIDLYQQALTIAREIGDKGGEGNALGNLGLAYHSLGDYAKAIEYHQQALTISRAIGDKHGEGNHLGNLGNAYFSLGDYTRAIDHFQQAITIRRAIGDRMGEANDLNNIGVLHEAQGNFAPAIQFYQQARTLYAAMQLNHEVERVDRIIERAKQAAARRG